MQRRSFIKQSVLWTAGCAVGSRMSLWGTVSAADEVKGTVLRSGELYKLFRDPQSIYRPFVRWWWNGDKVEADELKRELHILKEAGIGGVEINPVKFPGNDTDDLGKKSLPWLSDEWIDMLKVAFDEAKSLDMTVVIDQEILDILADGGRLCGTIETEENVLGKTLKLHGDAVPEAAKWCVLK